MENAGRAVVREIAWRFPPSRCLVLCGPGNNGGDGYVIARRLRDAGWTVHVATEPEWKCANGDATIARARWDGPCGRLLEAPIASSDLVVDALFGSGLKRDLGGSARSILRKIQLAQVPIVSVDIPSGIDGSTGAIRGWAPTVDLTVTFTRLKLGHALMPGRQHCGNIICCNIGISNHCIDKYGPHPELNSPIRWLDHLPRLCARDSKYDRGHLLALGGPASMTGASVLAATTAQAAGAGLVTMLCDDAARSTYAGHFLSVMTRIVRSADDLGQLLKDRRVTALLAGPGMGINPRTASMLEQMLRTGIPIVLDADAITIAANHRERFLPLLHDGCVLTPHEGEFDRLDNRSGPRLERCRLLASELKSVVILKGADTVIASREGRIGVNTTGPASLATAGSGDVLAGLVGGLLARGMPPFEAAGCAVWSHAHAALQAQPLASAADLPATIPGILDAVSQYGSSYLPSASADIATARDRRPPG